MKLKIESLVGGFDYKLLFKCLVSFLFFISVNKLFHGLAVQLPLIGVQAFFRQNLYSSLFFISLSCLLPLYVQFFKKKQTKIRSIDGQIVLYGLVITWAYQLVRIVPYYSNFLYLVATIAVLISIYFNHYFIFTLLGVGFWSLSVEALPLPVEYDLTDLELLINFTVVVAISLFVTEGKGFKRTVYFFGLIVVGACYFETFLAKYKVLGSLWGWPLENDFTRVVKFYLNFGGDLLYGSDTFKGWFVYFIEKLVTPIQFLVYLTEMLFPLAIFSRRLARALLFSIVGFHFVFFFVSGAFFWKWIVVDCLLLFLSFKVYRLNLAVWSGKNATFLLLIFLVFRNDLLLTSSLGWKDPKEFDLNVWMTEARPEGESKLPWVFEVDGKRLLPINPNVFQPFTKNFGMTWKFANIRSNPELSTRVSQQLDRLTGRGGSYFPLHSHLWFNNYYYNGMEVSKSLYLVKFHLTTQDNSHDIQIMDRPEVIFQKELKD